MILRVVIAGTMRSNAIVLVNLSPRIAPIATPSQPIGHNISHYCIVEKFGGRLHVNSRLSPYPTQALASQSQPLPATASATVTAASLPDRAFRKS